MGEFSPPSFSEPPSFFLFFSYPSNIEIILDFFKYFHPPPLPFQNPGSAPGVSPQMIPYERAPSSVPGFHSFWEWAIYANVNLERFGKIVKIPSTRNQRKNYSNRLRKRETENRNESQRTLPIRDFYAFFLLRKLAWRFILSRIFALFKVYKSGWSPQSFFTQVHFPAL